MITAAYKVFHKYLDGRYANMVVLTFGQIEDLLGFPLPSPARTDAAWWTAVRDDTGEPRCSDACSDAWRLAHRTAKPNLMAQHVVFERIG